MIDCCTTIASKSRNQAHKGIEEILGRRNSAISTVTAGRPQRSIAPHIAAPDTVHVDMAALYPAAKAVEFDKNTGKALSGCPARIQNPRLEMAAVIASHRP